MASDTGRLRRSLSLARQRAQTLQEKIAANGEELAYRAVKQPYVFTQIVRDDSDVPPQWRQPTDPAQQPLATRKTWPERTVQAKPRYYAFAQAPTLTQTPWEVERNRPGSQSQRSRHGRPSRLPSHIFEQLPHEIYSCILGHLEATYAQESNIDVSGRKMALRTICLTSKRWAKVGIEHLYRDLWLPSSVSSHKRARRFSMSRPKSKLELLLRTLNEAPSLSYLIRRVHITSSLASELAGNDVSEAQHRAAYKMLQDVIETCTEVELVTGYHPPATRHNAEWYKLLGSRNRINTHTWLLDLSQPPMFGSNYLVDLHERWQWLETLVLCKTNWSDDLFGPGIITAITNRLFALKHLMVSGFSKEDFHNGTLLSLPPLQSLRLQDLDGVTDHGIHQLSQSRNAFALHSLSLIDLELASLRTIQNLLINLAHLHRLRFIQTTSPALLIGTSPQTRSNLLSSPSLNYLHWDTLIPGPAIESLAHSLSSCLLPNLHALKIPSDPNGALQRLCRPIHRHHLTQADHHFLSSTSKQDKYTRSLRLSRLQAQVRIREMRARHSMSVVVQDEEGVLESEHVIGGYLGDIGSRVEYCLESDVQGGDEALVEVRDVLRGGGERSGNGGREWAERVETLF